MVKLALCACLLRVLFTVLCHLRPIITLASWKSSWPVREALLILQ